MAITPVAGAEPLFVMVMVMGEAFATGMFGVNVDTSNITFPGRTNGTWSSADVQLWILRFAAPTPIL